MNKKPFNEIEEQMKHLAEGWEPSFDEQSWQHMEKMLDARDDRRRPIAWWIWLLPVLLGIGIAGYFSLVKNTPAVTAEQPLPVNNNIAQQKAADPSLNTVAGEPALSTDNTPPSTATTNGNNINGMTAPLLTATANKNTRPRNSSSSSRNKSRSNFIFTQGDLFTENNVKRNRNLSDKPNASIALQAGEMQDSTASSGSQQSTPQDYTKQQSADALQEPILATVPDKETKPNDTDQVEKAILPLSTESSAEEKNKKDRTSKFYFSMAVGAEANGVDFPGLNKFSTRAGFTLGYHITEKISIATGFFAGNKKYVAGKNDYKAKPGSYWSMVDIKEVDANCRVFEIPLWLRYHFAAKGKIKPFASVGISSFIMDKEDYEYYYYRFGNPYNSSHTYRGNQHFFSVLRVAGGLEKKVSNNFFLSVQPGLAIPFGGVGDGQVKLYSTELLLGLKYRPFKKSK
jgi:hypothetical protein